MDRDGKVSRLKYEGLQFICYKCGTYGHSKEDCDHDLGSNRLPLEKVVDGIDMATVEDVTEVPAEGVHVVLDRGHDVSSVLHRIVTGKGLGAGVHEAIWIDGHIGKGQGREEFEVKDGSTPVNIQDANDMSWLEHSSEDEDHVFALSRDYVHGHAMWHDIGYEGDQ
ncbi:hypothetical protein GQ457_05G024290 [Hibiscus cannabinus]